MLKLLSSWKGAVEIDGEKFDSVQDALRASKTFDKKIHIVLHSDVQDVTQSTTDSSKQTIAQATDSTEYEIKVKKYMTQQATPAFDFMAKWNNDKPMPMRIMRGTVEKETRGMVYMNLHGFAQKTITCACCGKELTNPISRYYGIGPICLSKLGIVNAIDDVENIKEQLVNIKWSGWIIRSAITERKEIKND